MSTQPPENPWPAGGPPPPPGYWQPPPGAPPPWRPPPPIDKSRIRPRTFWYFVAAALFAACIIGSGLIGFNAVKHFFGPFDRFTAPGSVVVALEKGEGRSIYQQGNSNFNASDFRCSVRGEGTFSRPPLTPTTGSFEFTRGDGRTYYARLNFEAPVADRYRFECDAPGGNRENLAVGPRAEVGSLIARIFGAIGLFFAGIILGAAVAVPTLVMRNRSRQRLEREAAAQQG